MKLQNEYMAELKKTQAKNAPVASTPAAPPVQAQAQAQPQQDERPAVTAAQLDQARRQEQVAETPRPVPAPVQQTQTSAPQPQATVPAPVQQQAAAPAVHEGDVIDVGSLDVLPRITRAVKPQYPPLAARQKISATVFLTVLVSERGEVLDVKVLRGDARFGINDAAVRAMRAMRFSPPMKDGKAVRTWFPQTIDFKPGA
jgi:protein TonB